MLANPAGTSKSPLGTACFYAATYLCFVAACLLTYQATGWLRTGHWDRHKMSLIFLWTGWQRAPSLGWTGAQDLIDRSWQAMADCPITVAFSIAAVILGLIGFVLNTGLRRDPALRSAH